MCVCRVELIDIVGGNLSVAQHLSSTSCTNLTLVGHEEAARESCQTFSVALSRFLLSRFSVSRFSVSRRSIRHRPSIPIRIFFFRPNLGLCKVNILVFWIFTLSNFGYFRSKVWVFKVKIDFQSQNLSNFGFQDQKWSKFEYLMSYFGFSGQLV